MSAAVWCRLCQKAYPGEFNCPEHHEDLEPVPVVDADPDPDEDDGPAARPVCWNCARPSENPRNPRCNHCKESLVPPSLVLRFADGQVVLGRDETAQLGRVGRYGHVFARYPNVSRFHAVAGTDESGRGWIRPVREAPNGTFVNGTEITGLTVLESGSEVRFAAEVSGPRGQVTRPEFE